MKAKLIKLNDYYNLQDEKGNVIGTSYQFKSPVGDNLHKLSKQNCDSLFGVIDVEKLAKEKYPNVDNEDYEYDSEWQMLADEYKQKGFIQGAKEILELNKDKVFTEDDVNLAFVLGKNKDESRVNKLINSRLQPIEIDVEVVTTTRMENGKSGIDTPTIKPKLDSDGCLILKRVV